ncbi:MAG: hypothetical protein DMD54_09400 [Gemmatimonadetes bacterium]|nr:MAG: hypothetical protein DMD54_09400 [Gemmatimonadota bacterium]
MARGRAHRRLAGSSRRGKGRPGDVPRPALPARHRGSRAGYGAHRGQESGRVGVSHPRRPAASRNRRARRRPFAGRDRQAVPHRGPVVVGRSPLPERRSYGVVDERFERYITELFAAEDPVLSKIRARHESEKLPAINVSPEEGKLLHLLLLLIQAKNVLEIGSLGGYSGVWLARALPADGRLVTIERDPKHARIAREAFAAAGLQDRIELIEGPALEVLPTLKPGFDAVFIDADKEPLPHYFAWGMKLLRGGGLLLCDNAFFHGAAVDPNDDSPNAEGVRKFNELASRDPRLVATIIPVRDGLVIGVKTRDKP